MQNRGTRIPLNKAPERLFIFAHRGEAQSFIKKGHFTLLHTPSGTASGTHPSSAPFFEERLYTNQQDLLFLCGEGPRSALMLTAQLLGHLEALLLLPEQIINAGTAGYLSPEKPHWRYGDVVLIRTVFGHDGRYPLFHTYTTKTGTEKMAGQFSDCVTSESRVRAGILEEEKLARKLASLALVVDREAHALATVAKQFKIPFNSFKVISDSMSINSTLPAEINREHGMQDDAEENSPTCKIATCNIVRQEADFFSDQLYNFWQEHKLTTFGERPKDDDHVNFATNPTSDAELVRRILGDQWKLDFYWTHAMLGQLKKLLKTTTDQLDSLASLPEILEQALATNTLSQCEQTLKLQDPLEKRSPKERSLALLKILESFQRPVMHDFAQRLERWTTTMAGQNITFQWPQNFETSEGKMTFHFDALRPAHNHQVLKNISWEQLEKLMKLEGPTQ